MPSGKPDRQRRQRAPCHGRALLHERDAEARQRPELRADDHRADDQDRLVEEDADRGDQHRQDHEGQEASPTSSVLLGCGTRPPPRPPRPTAGPARASPPRSAASESCGVDEVERDRPVSGMSSSRRSWMITLASSRATSAEDHVALGLPATPWRWITLRPSPRRRAGRAPAWPCRAGRRSGGGSCRPPPGRARAPRGRRPGSAPCRPPSRSMKTWRSSPSVRSVPSRSTSMWRGHAGGAQAADRGRDLDLVVEAGRRQVAQRASATTMSDARLHHRPRSRRPSAVRKSSVIGRRST